MCFIEPISVSNYEVKHSAVSLFKLSLMDINQSNPLDFLEKISQQYSIWLSWRVYEKQHVILAALAHTLRHCLWQLDTWGLDSWKSCHTTTAPASASSVIPSATWPRLQGRYSFLLHLYLLGMVFQDDGQGCAEELEGMGHHIGQDQANHNVSVWGQRGGVWLLAIFRLLVIYQKLPTLSEWGDLQYDKRRATCQEQTFPWENGKLENLGKLYLSANW